MRVLQVIEALTIGGAERLVIELTRELAARRVDSRILCLSAPGAWARDAETDGLYAGCLGKNPGLDLSIVSKLKGAIERLAPDVVQSHLFTANLWARLAALWPRRWRLVTTLHNQDAWRGWRHRAADRLLARVPDACVAVSEAVAGYYGNHGIPAGRLSVIPNGIAPGSELPVEPLSAGVPVIRACGRLVPNKGFDVLVSAARLLCDRGASFRLEIVGDGPVRSELEKAIGDAGVSDCVRLLGERTDARSLIAGADVFVLSSRLEGLPLVVLEALHAARPVVATDIAGLMGIVENGVTGLVVPVENPAGLAGAVERLIRDPALARRLGLEGQRLARSQFSIGRTADAYMALYATLVNGKGL